MEGWKIQTHNYRQVQTVCPACETKVWFYSNGIPKEHYCTVCHEVVEIPKEAVAF